MKKVYKSIFFLAIIGLIILFISHYRYPFIQYGSDGWSIGITRTSDPLQISLNNIEIYSKEWLDSITPEKTRFLADPFLFYEDGISYIFFEHQTSEGNGTIDLLYSSDGEKFIYKGNVLKEPFHLSFPNVFKKGGSYYMLPETKGANNVLLYKARNFPYDWEIYDTIIKNKKFKDPVLLLADSLNILMVSDDNLTQYMYSADSLHGKWEIEKKFSLRKGDETRAAGNFFNYKNEWLLPLQNNSNGYGSGVSIYQLIQNKENIFLKKQVKNFLTAVPEIKWFNHGMHHMNVTHINDHYVVVVDGDMVASVPKNNFSWKASLKYNYYDLIRWCENFVKN